MSERDRAGAFGSIYLPALRRVRNLWLDFELLVEKTSFDDVVSPTELHVELADGLGTASTARFDIQWSELDNYPFHHTDSNDMNWRFDRHLNTHSDEVHFHSPPDASTNDAKPSCIHVEAVSLVTRAVHVMWRAASTTTI